MSLGIIVHQQTYNTDAGVLGAALNTFYKRKLTLNLVNENGVIATFRDSTGSPANTFDLNDGTYRIEAWMTFYIAYGFDATPETASAVAALYNEDDNSVAATFTPAYSSDSVSSLASSGAASASINIGRMVTLQVMDAFAVSGGPKRFSFQAAVAGATNWANNSDTCGKSHGIATVVGGAALVNTYLFAKIIQKV